MATILEIYANNDSQDLPLNTSAVDWTLLDVSADYLVFSAGSAAVADGQSLPSTADLNS
ncbi:hypothetical protein LCGC14_1926230, partial [marine sediment metagenome]